jgi:hypothetical protein
MVFGVMKVEGPLRVKIPGEGIAESPGPEVGLWTGGPAVGGRFKAGCEGGTGETGETSGGD